MAGYRLAMREACKYIRDKIATPVDKLGRPCLVSAAKTAISSKILGGADSELFAELAVSAVLAVKKTKVDEFASTGDMYPIKAIHVLKALGGSAAESELLPGYAIQATRASQQMPQRVTGAKIACLDVDLRRTKMKMGVNVLLTDPAELEKIQQKELDITKDRIKAVLASGANVVLTSKGIDDSALKYFVEAGVIAVRRVSDRDLYRVAKASGAQLLTSLADLAGEESFDASMLGYADEVFEQRIQMDNILIVKGCKTTSACSVLLRGPNEMMCDEMQRSFHDAVCVVKRTLESNYIVPGGGCVEASLSVYLEKFAELIGSREQLAIAEFSEALLVIPKTLSSNAAKDAIDLVAQLRAVHYAAQKPDEKPEKAAAYARCGLDLTNGKIRDSIAAGVLEPSMSKIRSIQFATEACLTILRIDDMITLDKREPGMD